MELGKNLPNGIDRQTCQRLRFVPDIAAPNGGRYWIDDSTDLALLPYFAYLTQCHDLPARVAPNELDRTIEARFPTEESQRSHGGPNSTPSAEPISEGKVVALINEIVHDAIAEKASDIHFEPAEQWLACRVRIDGLLVHRKTIDRETVLEVVSRLKIMAGLDIAEKRRPQDGRIRFQYDDRLVDIRVSVIPTDFGEKVVLRLLDKATLRLDLEMLGFTPQHLRLFKEKISLANGIVLVTGPTGSGKTTTLYAALNYLKSPHVNICTVEDPIEYNLPGINQTQVRPEIDVSFSNMLRALLRQDPNIIMVGEIRDSETLEIAVRASLTGHLVISTIHTNSSVATISRLIDMGAEPFMLTSSLRLIVAQRLLRLNCPRCASETLSESNRAAAVKLGFPLSDAMREGIGCPFCHQTGFSGRTAVYELLDIDDKVKDAVIQGKSEMDILQVARAQGFSTLLESAQELVAQGKTTPLEVLREINI